VLYEVPHYAALFTLPPSSQSLSVISIKKEKNKYNYQKEDILKHGRVTVNKMPLIPAAVWKLLVGPSVFGTVFSSTSRPNKFYTQTNITRRYSVVI
jgi:hypothetical protein